MIAQTYKPLTNELCFKNVVEDIKQRISNTQYEIFKNANMNLLKLYYYIGKTISENSSWGNKFIDELAVELKITFPNIKGFSVRNLKSMKKYYLECSKNKKVQMTSAQIPWSHNILILDKIKEDEKRKKTETLNEEEQYVLEILLTKIDDFTRSCDKSRLR